MGASNSRGIPSKSLGGLTAAPLPSRFFSPFSHSALLFPGEMGNRRTKMPIIRKDFLAVFVVQMELESNGKKKKSQERSKS